jgi:hypothetical protein
MLSASKKLDKILKQIAKYEENENNKAKGYEPKCKVCNHKDKEEIERLHELGHTNRGIIRELYLEDDFSEMALSRHLRNHYPKSKNYYEKIRLLEEKEIQEAINECPSISKYLLDDNPKYRKMFLNNYGYCIDNCHFCELIPKKQIACCDDVMDQLQAYFKNIKDDYSYNKQDKTIDIMTKLNKCYSCQLFHMKATYDTLLTIIYNKLFNTEIYIERDIDPIIKTNDYDIPNVLEDLEELNKNKD